MNQDIFECILEFVPTYKDIRTIALVCNDWKNFSKPYLLPTLKTALKKNMGKFIDLNDRLGPGFSESYSIEDPVTEITLCKLHWEVLSCQGNNIKLYLLFKEYFMLKHGEKKDVYECFLNWDIKLNTASIHYGRWFNSRLSCHDVSTMFFLNHPVMVEYQEGEENERLLTIENPIKWSTQIFTRKIDSMKFIYGKTYCIDIVPTGMVYKYVVYKPEKNIFLIVFKVEYVNSSYKFLAQWDIDKNILYRQGKTSVNIYQNICKEMFINSPQII